MVVNSVDAPRGNTELSKGTTIPGMCREHGPPPEGKMCSELHGNVQGNKLKRNRDDNFKEQNRRTC